MRPHDPILSRWITPDGEPTQWGRDTLKALEMRSFHFSTPLRHGWSLQIRCLNGQLVTVRRKAS